MERYIRCTKEETSSLRDKRNIDDSIDICKIGNYYISSDGRVFSERYYKELKQEETNKGYLRVHLFNDGIDLRESVHRLVAKCFVANPENKPQVNHIDGNKHNNDRSNLEWCTVSENVKHSYKYLERKSSGRKGCSNSLSKAVVCIDTGEIFDNARIAAEAKGTHPQHICHCCICYEGRVKAGGLRWAYWNPKPLIKKAFNVGYKVWSNFEKEDDKILWTAKIIDWLEEQGILIDINPINGLHFYWMLRTKELDEGSGKYMWECQYTTPERGTEYPSRKEATLAAIDAALEYLTNKK